ncbi:hypothetical protein DCCM_0341 [Desulfocucumis palustris]|uniref:Uncharacterized protein n=1 Tax=Desulfocucumis palustris TaxID=1898651 RepID=A0A2L2X809_9FIRM|nr:hypothetical protein DCCM_0341 [Desulfocucumis palustris]
MFKPVMLINRLKTLKLFIKILWARQGIILRRRIYVVKLS